MPASISSTRATPADEFYLIRHGRVALEMTAPGRAAVTFQTVPEGDMVGVSWLIPPYRWAYDARAVDLVRAIGIDAKCLRQKCESDHDLGYDDDEALHAGPGRAAAGDPAAGARCLRHTALTCPRSARPRRVGGRLPIRCCRVIERVARVRREGADIWTLEIEPRRRLRLPARPVQHALRLRRRRGGDLDQRRPGRSRRGWSTPSAPSAASPRR